MFRSRTILAVLLAATAWAEDYSFTCTTDKSAIAYQPGEKMAFSVQFLVDGKPAAGRKLTWTRRGDDQKNEKGEAVSSDAQPLLIETSLAQPGFVHVIVTPIGDDGKPLKDAKGKEVKFEGGAGVQPEELDGLPEPADFDAFWAKQKAKLAAVPLKATLVPAESKNKDFEVFDVKVDCAGGKPVSGYLSRPKGAAAKSLGGQVNFMGYGVSTPWPDYKANTLSFTINAHGIENGKDQAYYDELKNGALKGYAFDKAQNADPETAYFNGMMLRVLRALEYVKSLPEWNGKDLTANGGSQGGLQALVAAGVDPQVNRCWAWKPWCCDLGGVTLNRLSGWRPAWSDALGYYDPINHAKRIRCETVISSGLGDYTCPPSTLAVLYNRLAGKKRIDFIQGANHMVNPPKAPTFSLDAAAK
ncbi:MAG: acetylxylan esterase [Planctomycetes bacterium]|nr:acetylxylan esterase [Planctomycetota bacterium]